MGRRAALLLFTGILLLTLGAAATQEPKAPAAGNVAQRLGYPADAKLLIIHADDIGVSHSANLASFDALKRGAVTAGSIMVPCPWFPEVVSWAKQNPDADVGVHFTDPLSRDNSMNSVGKLGGPLTLARFVRCRARLLAMSHPAAISAGVPPVGPLLAQAKGSPSGTEPQTERFVRSARIGPETGQSHPELWAPVLGPSPRIGPAGHGSNPRASPKALRLRFCSAR